MAELTSSLNIIIVIVIIIVVVVVAVCIAIEGTIDAPTIDALAIHARIEAFVAGAQATKADF